jgi:hypothetical protein
MVKSPGKTTRGERRIDISRRRSPQALLSMPAKSIMDLMGTPRSLPAEIDYRATSAEDKLRHPLFEGIGEKLR